MSLVVADTSPINYLVLIDCVSVLQRLYGTVVIPAEVSRELTAPGAPPEVVAWAKVKPAWTKSASARAQFNLTTPGWTREKRDAIQIALSEPGALLLIDETAGPLAATRLGISSTGTLGVLLAAAHAGLIDLQAALARLQTTNFRVSEALIARLLAGAAPPGARR